MSEAKLDKKIRQHHRIDAVRDWLRNIRTLLVEAF